MGYDVDVYHYGENMECVQYFSNLGSEIHESGRMSEETGSRVREEERVRVGGGH